MVDRTHAGIAAGAAALTAVGAWAWGRKSPLSPAELTSLEQALDARESWQVAKLHLQARELAPPSVDWNLWLQGAATDRKHPLFEALQHPPLPLEELAERWSLADGFSAAERLAWCQELERQFRELIPPPLQNLLAS